MSPVDVGLIASAAIPYVVKGADAFSKAVGEKLAGKVVEVCQAIEKKFKGDSYAEQTLARAREKPDSEKRKSALEDLLGEKMEDDPAFAEIVAKLVKEIQKAQSPTGTVFDQRGQTVHGSQTNIAGDVKGDVFSGSFSGPVTVEKRKRAEE